VHQILKSQDGNAGNVGHGKEMNGKFKGNKCGDKDGERQKSAIELAREKFAAQKLASFSGKPKSIPPRGIKVTGANAI